MLAPKSRLLPPSTAALLPADAARTELSGLGFGTGSSLASEHPDAAAMIEAGSGLIINIT
jgi:hypothetical protein